MRLVSAAFQCYYPFDSLPFVDDLFTTCYPEDLAEGDLLVVWGGEDISPALYNKGRSQMGHGSSQPSQRDRIEWDLMQQAKVMGIPIIGVCRGAQMMCAMEGGFLFQHVDNHGGDHVIKTNKGEKYLANSLHHQMMVPSGNFELIAWTEPRSKKYHDVVDVQTSHPLGVDPEFIYYPEIKGFAIQWHPEMTGDDEPVQGFVKRFIEEKLNVAS